MYLVVHEGKIYTEDGTQIDGVVSAAVHNHDHMWSQEIEIKVCTPMHMIAKFPIKDRYKNIIYKEYEEDLRKLIAESRYIFGPEQSELVDKIVDILINFLLRITRDRILRAQNENIDEDTCKMKPSWSLDPNTNVGLHEMLNREIQPITAPPPPRPAHDVDPYMARLKAYYSVYFLGEGGNDGRGAVIGRAMENAVPGEELQVEINATRDLNGIRQWWRSFHNEH